MSLLVAQQGTFIDSAAQRVDRELREGNGGFGWPGDPRLWLELGIQTNRAGHEIDRRWLVKMRCNDGKVRPVAWWYEHELDRILPDMIRMDPSRPGHVDVQDSIDAANAAIEKEVSRQYRDAAGEMLDHASRLNHDLNNSVNRFRLNDVGAAERKQRAKASK